MFLPKLTSCQLTATIALLISIGLTACSNGLSTPQTTVDEQGDQDTVGITENADESSDLEGNDNTGALGETSDVGETNNTNSTNNTENGDPINNQDNSTVIESNGIKIEMPASNASLINIEFVEFGSITTEENANANALYDLPTIKLRITNNSDSTIQGVRCKVAALQNGAELGEALLSPGGLAHLRTGDTAIDTGIWFYALDDPTVMDTAKVSCSWRDYGNTVSSSTVFWQGYDDEENDPLIEIELIEYSTNEDNTPVVVAQISNGTANTIYAARCQLAIRKGNEVLSYAEIRFNDMDDIASGESFMGRAVIPLPDFERGFEQFDSDVFYLKDLYCSYQIR